MRCGVLPGKRIVTQALQNTVDGRNGDRDAERADEPPHLVWRTERVGGNNGERDKSREPHEFPEQAVANVRRQ